MKNELHDVIRRAIRRGMCSEARRCENPCSTCDAADQALQEFERLLAGPPARDHELRKAVAELVETLRDYTAPGDTRDAEGRVRGLFRALSRVRALLAAPVTEPASVRELREAIEAERVVGTFSYSDKDAARARVDAILARLDAPIPAPDVERIRAEAQRPWREAMEKLVERAEKAERERDEARAERDAIAARYDALRGAAEALSASARRIVGEQDVDRAGGCETPRRGPNNEYRYPCAACRVCGMGRAVVAVDAALADPDGAARERAERQAERERAIAREGYRRGHYGLVGLGVLPDREADDIIASVRGRT